MASGLRNASNFFFGVKASKAPIAGKIGVNAAANILDRKSYLGTWFIVIFALGSKAAIKNATLRSVPTIKNAQPKRRNLPTKHSVLSNCT